jgi:hypothetical protein
MKTLSWIRQRQPLWMPALAAVAAMALAGCATMAAPPEKVVEQRAAAYWKARVAGDYGRAYELSTPAYRKLHTVEEFRKQFGSGVAVQSAEPVNVTCEPEKCVVRIKIGATPALLGMNLGTIATHLSETWLLEDGQWWRYQDL